MYEPTPGWLALKLRRCGHELALTVLAAGYLDGWTDHAREMYLALAECTDPFHQLRSIYLAASQQHPWLLQAVQPLLAWVERPDYAVEAALRRAAGILAEVDLYFVWAESGGDPLGAVHNELTAMDQRQREPVQHCDVGNISRRYGPDGWADVHFEPDDVFIDTAAATCVRPYTHAVNAAKEGYDPTTMTWLIADFDPLVLALGAVQFTNAHPGDNVHFAVADYPANITTTWPMWDQEAAGRLCWQTDLPETLVRLGADIPPDQFWRGLPGLMLQNDPTFKTIVTIAHGFRETDQETYEWAVEHVSDPDFMLKGMIAALDVNDAEDHEDVEYVLDAYDAAAMSGEQVVHGDDFFTSIKQFRNRFEAGQYAQERT